MSKSIVVNFNLDSDIQNLMYTYQEQISYCEFMIEKLKSNSYKSDNSKEIMQYSLELLDLKESLKKLEQFD